MHGRAELRASGQQQPRSGLGARFLRPGWRRTGLLVAVCSLASFFYGMAVVKFNVFPYPIGKAAYDLAFDPARAAEAKRRQSLAKEEAGYRADLARVAGEDPDWQRLQATSLERVAELRARLIERIYGSPEAFRDGRPDTVEELPAAALRVHLEGVKLSAVRMAGAVHGISYQTFLYSNLSHPNGRLVIYHELHGTDPLDTKSPYTTSPRAIARLLAEGYDVLALSMPFHGWNKPPKNLQTYAGILPTVGMGIQYPNHNVFTFLQTPEFSPIRVFMAPISESLNYVLATRQYRSVSMTGISGGGWATTLYAALDERIRQSVSFFGSVPFYTALIGRYDLGDWEQFGADIYRIVNYLDLYVMASAGAGRRHVEIYNQFDRCCFWGFKGEHYAPTVAAAVQRLGAGEFGLRVLEGREDHLMDADVLLSELAAFAEPGG